MTAPQKPGLSNDEFIAMRRKLTPDGGYLTDTLREALDRL